jgi:hypothetical protein
MALFEPAGAFGASAYYRDRQQSAIKRQTLVSSQRLVNSQSAMPHLSAGTVILSMHRQYFYSWP